MHEEFVSENGGCHNLIKHYIVLVKVDRDDGDCMSSMSVVPTRPQALTKVNTW